MSEINEHGLDKNGLHTGEKELWRNSQWRITTTHLETVPGTRGYWIFLTSLEHGDWLKHLSGKRWVDVAALEEALLKVAELTSIKPRLTGGTL